MMQVRCQRCGWVFTMSRDAIGIALAEAEASHAEHYQEHCPKCRNVVKIQVKELRRRLPADYVLPTLPPKPAPIHAKKDEEPTAAALPQAAASSTGPGLKQAAESRAEAAATPDAEPESRAAPKARPKPKAAAERAVKR